MPKTTRKLFLVGTIHSNHTPDDELKKVLEDIQPDQVFVELPENFSAKEIEEGKVVPTEMLFAYRWAKDKNIPTVCFDVDSSQIEGSVFNDGYGESSPEYQKYLDENTKIINKHRWKEFNTLEITEKLDHPLEKILFDQYFIENRENKMVENVKNNLLDEERIVIITGAGHLQHFKENLPNTTIPLGK